METFHIHKTGIRDYINSLETNKHEPLSLYEFLLLSCGILGNFI